MHIHSYSIGIEKDDSFEVKEQKHLKAIESHPEVKDEYLYSLYQLYKYNEMNEKAFPILLQALEVASSDDNKGFLLHTLSWNYEEREDYINAVKCLKQLIELEPNHPDWVFQLGDIYVKAGDYENAIETYEKAKSIPDEEGNLWDYDYLSHMAKLNINKEEYGEALDYFDKMLNYSKSDEGKSHIYRQISEMYQKLDENSEAFNYAQKAYDLKPDLSSITCLARCYFNNKQFDEALDMYSKMLPFAENNPLNTKWYQRYYNNSVAPIYLEMKNYDKAIDCYKKVIENEERDNYSIDALLSITSIYCELRQYKEAKPYLQKIIKMRPNQNAHAYSSMAMYYLDEENDNENAINYLLKAGQVNNQTPDNVKGDNNELAFSIYSVIGRINLNEYKDEEQAIYYFKLALDCSSTKEREEDICTHLYNIYNGRGDEENAKIYKERRTGLAEFKDIFSGNWTPPPPPNLNERLKNPKNTKEEIENLSYHYTKMKKDQVGMDFHKQTYLLFEQEIENNPAIQEYLKKYDSFHNKKFIFKYIEHKMMLVSLAKYHTDPYETSDERILRTNTERILELILQKKLFNMQLLWRAEKIKIPEINICYDFEYWSDNIRKCPFDIEITQNDISIMKEFLMDNNFDDNTRDWLCGWQSYDKIMKKGDDGDSEYMPEWYEYYDSKMGTGSLLSLPDIRGKKEKKLIKQYYKWFNKQPKEEAIPVNIKSYLPILLPMDNEYTKFMELFENDYICQLHQGHIDTKKIYHENFNEDAVYDAVMYLKYAKTPVYIEGGMLWQDAIIRAAQKYNNSCFSDNLDQIFENYMIKRELKFSSHDDEEDDINDISFRNEQAEQILKARELLGEPRDFNF